MKAVGNGSAVIVAIATDGTNKYAECKVEATVLVSDFWFNQTEHTMYHYQYMQMGYTWTPWNAKNPSLSWKSSDKDIATVDQNGTVYSNNGIWNGSAWITGTTVDGSNITRSFLVHVKEAFVEGISLSDSSINLKVGQGYGFGWSTWPDYAANHSVSWSSNNGSVATVNGGWVTAKGAGTCTITATTYPGHSASCTVTVTGGASSGGGNNNNPSKPNVKVTGVSLNASKKTLDTLGSFTLTAIVSPKNATNKAVTWSSSNTNIATVNSSGKVTAKKAGTATITVKTNDGSKTASCTVTVEDDKFNRSYIDSQSNNTILEINNEHKYMKDIPLGDGNIAQNGCGVIAAYNALLSVNAETNFASVKSGLEKNALFAGGLFGVSAVGLSNYLEKDFKVYTSNFEEDDYAWMIHGNADAVIFLFQYEELLDPFHYVAGIKTSDMRFKVFNDPYIYSTDEITILDFLKNRRENNCLPILIMGLYRR